MIRPIRYSEDAIERIVIIDDATITVGDVVKLVEKGVEPADAVTDRIYGVVVGIGSQAGIPISQLTSGTDYDGTWTESTKTYVAANDNDTDKLIAAYVVPAEGQIFEADIDAARGTNTGSDVVGYYLSVLTSDSTQLDESTATGTSEQFVIVKNHETSTTKTYVKVVEHQCYN